MKKIILSLVFLMITGFCTAQIINFPDPNFKAKLLDAAPGLQIAYGPNGSMKIDVNNDGEIQVSEALQVWRLYLYGSNITSVVGLEHFVNLKEFNCYYNSIASMDLSPLTLLTRINIPYNQITSLNVTGLSQVEWLNCHFNDLTSLDLTGMTSMYLLQCQNNQLTSLNFSNATNLSHINCENNLLSTIDTSTIDELISLRCLSNNLIQLNVKNDYQEAFLDFSNNPNLQFICADEIQMLDIQHKMMSYGYTNCIANSSCSFVPGNPIYAIQGITRYDELVDGCDNTDIIYPELQFSMLDGSNTSTIYSNSNGLYSTATQSNSITLTPQLVNPAYFVVTPNSQTLSLTNATTPLVQNFCVAANGLHPDLEVSLARTNQSSSEYIYYYELTYKNTGTNTQSGNLSLEFNDIQQDFQTSTPAVASSTTDLLTWNFSDLKPFETRYIQITFYMHLGTTLFDEDILHYEASVSSPSIDETPNNNTFALDEVYTSVVLNAPDLTFSDYFYLYPNPAQDVLNIKGKNDVSINNITVYTILGQNIHEKKGESDETSIDVSNYTNGTYIIKIVSDKGIFNSKFVKN